MVFIIFSCGTTPPSTKDSNQMFPGNGEFVEHSYGEDLSNKIKDWKSESVLFCGLKKHTQWALESDSEINNWLRENPGKKFPCAQYDFTRSGVTMCAYDKTPDYKIEINELSSSIQKCALNSWSFGTYCNSSQDSNNELHGTINLDHYQIIKIQTSEEKQQFRIRALNIMDREKSKGKFITYTSPNKTEKAYEFKFNLNSRYGVMDVKTSADFRLSRDSLKLDIKKYLQGDRNEPYKERLFYDCRVVNEVEVDEFFASLPAIRANWGDSLSKILKERKEAQRKKNKI